MHIWLGAHLAASPLLIASLRPETAAVPRHRKKPKALRTEQQTLPSAWNVPSSTKTSTSQERNLRRSWKELPAALEQTPARQGLIGELQPSSLQSLSVPKGKFRRTVPVVLGSHTSQGAGNSPQCIAEGEKGFSSKPAHTGQAVSLENQPQQQEVKRFWSWKQKM